MINNYHGHTIRCHHAQGSDKAYVEQAIAEGFSTYGFSDHTPWPYIGFTSSIRMDVSELEGYCSSLRSLSSANSEKIHIMVGLECECFPNFFPWLDEMKERYQLDYLILGNHFIGDEQTGVYAGKAITKDQVLSYEREVAFAMSTHRFAYLAHPDIIFSSYTKFDDVCRGVSHAICDLSIKYGFPLEYNLLGIKKRKEGRFVGLGYPCPEFWDIVGESGCKVIVGLDAHDPAWIDGSFFSEQVTELKERGFKLVDSL